MAMTTYFAGLGLPGHGKNFNVYLPSINIVGKAFVAEAEVKSFGTAPGHFENRYKIIDILSETKYETYYASVSYNTSEEADRFSPLDFVAQHYGVTPLLPREMRIKRLQCDCRQPGEIGILCEVFTSLGYSCMVEFWRPETEDHYYGHRTLTFPRVKPVEGRTKKEDYREEAIEKIHAELEEHGLDCRIITTTEYHQMLEELKPQRRARWEQAEKAKQLPIQTFQHIQSWKPPMLGDSSFVTVIYNPCEWPVEVPVGMSQHSGTIAIPPKTFLHCTRFSPQPDVWSHWEHIPEKEAANQTWWFEYQGPDDGYILVKTVEEVPVQCPTPEHM